MGVQVHKHDEMASMVNGLAFVLKYANRSSFSVPTSGLTRNRPTSPDMRPENQSYSFEEERQTDFPKLLVTIGSGVSLIKVNDFNNFERVGGTMIGGGTLLGLSNLLTGIKDFDTII
jgi:type II pantothenate kinase